MKRITQRNADILAFMMDYHDDHGFWPSVHRISEEFGFIAITSAENHIKRLEEAGCLRVHRPLKKAYTVVKTPW